MNCETYSSSFAVDANAKRHIKSEISQMLLYRADFNLLIFVPTNRNSNFMHRMSCSILIWKYIYSPADIRQTFNLWWSVFSSRKQYKTHLFVTVMTWAYRSCKRTGNEKHVACFPFARKKIRNAETYPMWICSFHWVNIFLFPAFLRKITGFSRIYKSIRGSIYRVADTIRPDQLCLCESGTKLEISFPIGNWST